MRKAISDITSFITEATATLDGYERSRGDSMGHGTFYKPGTEGALTAEAVASELAQLPRNEVDNIMQALEDDMRAASAKLDFEEAARLRDQLVRLRSLIEGSEESSVIELLKKNARKSTGPGAPGPAKRFNKHAKH